MAVDSDDSTANNQVSFSLTAVNPASVPEKFAVSSNGLVTVQGSVTAGEVYYLTITATDNGNPALTSTAVVLVNVIPVGNQAPQVRNQTLMVLEP